MVKNVIRIAIEELVNASTPAIKDQSNGLRSEEKIELKGFQMSIIECPNSFEGVENYRFDLNAGENSFDLYIDYWFHNDLDRKNYANRLIFNHYRFLNFEKMVFQDEVFESKVAKFDHVYFSRDPFPSMNISMAGEAGEVNRNLIFYQTLIYGLGFLQVAAKNVELRSQDIKKYWGVNSNDG